MDGHCDKGSENYANIGMKGFGGKGSCWIDARMNGSLVFDAWFQEASLKNSFLRVQSWKVVAGRVGVGINASLMRFELF